MSSAQHASDQATSTLPDPASMAFASALTFAMEGEIFAIDAQSVREIVEVPPITAVPGATAALDGLVNVRGRIVPVADLRVAFGMDRAPLDDDCRIIVIETDLDGEATTIGLLAEKVLDVANLEGLPIEPAPALGMRWRSDFVAAIVHRDAQFVILPSLPVILSSFQGGAAAASPNLA
ncbi:chemotaxis protein CheW [Novosphingobium sp.]|uniref:chemotaxis protein CheW n=1 Tax=Novosphingobium sp. TaxID=1874826 RepID=UPI0038BB5523